MFGEILGGIGAGASAFADATTAERDQRAREAFERRKLEVQQLVDELAREHDVTMENTRFAHETELDRNRESDTARREERQAGQRTQDRVVDRALANTDRDAARRVAQMERDATTQSQESFIKTLSPDEQKRARGAILGITLPAPARENLERVDTINEQGQDVTQFVAPRAGQSFLKLKKDEARDDPALPQGVRSYISGFGPRYADRAGAEEELRKALPDLQRDHPRLDVNKAFQLLDGVYGTRPPKKAVGEGGFEDLPPASGTTAASAAPPPAAAPPARPSAFPTMRPVASHAGAPAAAAPAPKPSVPNVDASAIPAPVRSSTTSAAAAAPAVLSGADIKPGKYTLTDGTVWIVQPGQPPQQVK